MKTIIETSDAMGITFLTMEDGEGRTRTYVHCGDVERNIACRTPNYADADMPRGLDETEWASIENMKDYLKEVITTAQNTLSEIEDWEESE